MLEKLLTAMLELSSAIKTLTETLAATPTKPAKGKAATADAPAAGATAAVTATAAMTPATSTPQTASNAAAAGQSSADAKLRQDTVKAVETVANLHRQTAVDLLAKYGAANFGGLKVEHYAAMKADCDAWLKARENPAPTGAAGLI